MPEYKPEWGADYGIDELWEEEICERCGEVYGEGEGCPECRSCGGDYACGSEECDWCKYSRECERLSR